MKSFAHVAVMIAAFLAIGAQGEKRKEQWNADSLEGTWEPVSGQANAKALTRIQLARRCEGAPITFQGGRLRIVESIMYTFDNPEVCKEPKWEELDLWEWPLAFTLEPARSPKELDIHWGEEGSSPVIARCIYSIQRDTLTVCWGTPTARPTEFRTAEGDDFVLVVYEREKGKGKGKETEVSATVHGEAPPKDSATAEARGLPMREDGVKVNERRVSRTERCAESASGTRRIVKRRWPWGRCESGRR